MGMVELVVQSVVIGSDAPGRTLGGPFTYLSEQLEDRTASRITREIRLITFYLLLGW